MNAGLSPDVRKLDSDDSQIEPLSHLTARQREGLEIASYAGYYDVPRQVFAEEIADELDVDASTVTEHLQRAQRNLLIQFLATSA